MLLKNDHVEFYQQRKFKFHLSSVEVGADFGDNPYFVPRLNFTNLIDLKVPLNVGG